MSRLIRRVTVFLCLLVSLPPTIAILVGAGPDLTTLPPPGRLLEVGGGVKLNVVEKGAGEPLILVHGLPGIAADWDPLFTKLATTNRVIAYDRAGYGYSDKPDGGFEVISDARRLLELMGVLGLDQATLIGWSYGGGVVQEAARLAPDRADHLVLIAAVGPALNALEEPRNAMLVVLVSSPLGLPLARWVFAVPPLARAVVRSQSAEAFSTKTGLPPYWLERSYAHMSQWGSLRTFIEEARRMRPKMLKPEEVQTPTLVISGTNDLLVPVSVAKDLDRRLPHSELAIITGASHMVPVTHTVEVAKRIVAFLGASAK